MGTIWQFSFLRLVILFIPLLVGCGSVEPRNHSENSELQGQPEDKSDPISLATRMIGKPYKFGGYSPRTGFDCSGLMYYSYQKQIPRSSILQYRASKAVKRSKLQPGDLVFFDIGYTKIKTKKRKSSKSKKVSHVGLYIGEGQFIHAPSSGKHVMKSSLQQDYWRQRFVRGGRF